MCQQHLFGPYPCGHVETKWEHCAAARARALLRNNPLQAASKKDPAPCAKPLVVAFPADLNTACPRTCLTKPFRCCRCLRGGDDARQNEQVGWACEHCGHVRCGAACLVWTGCGCAHCRGAACRELVPQRVGDDGEGRTARACPLCVRGACVRKTAEAAETHPGEGAWWKAGHGKSQGK